MKYDNHRYMTAPAVPRAEPWRSAAGFVAIALLTGFLNMAYFAVISTLDPVWARTYLTSPGLGQTPGSLLVLLASFGLAVISTAAVVRVLHQRSFRSVLGPLGPLVRDFLLCMKYLLPLLALVFLLPAPEGEEPIRHLALGTWLALLPFALTGLLLQVSSEEILFRGYLQQQIAARSNSPILWMLIPSMIFAVGHYDPGAGAATPYIIVWALLFGMAASDLTARAGNLGPAIAMHLANNAIAMLVLALPDSFSGLALYHYPYTMDEIDIASPMIILDAVHLLIAWLACRLAIRC